MRMCGRAAERPVVTTCIEAAGEETSVDGQATDVVITIPAPDAA